MKAPISRRSLIAGFSISAASVAGAGVDRFLATDQKRREIKILSEIAARKQNVALRRLAHEDAEKQAAAASVAQKDKDTALAQFKAQFPSGRDPTISVGFEKLSSTYPWIAQKIRRGVGFLEYQSSSIILRGAAELLDHNGTLSFCGHEFISNIADGTELSVTFFPELGLIYKIPVKITNIDREKDIAFAVLSDADAPSIISRYNLEPVQWDKPFHKEKQSNHRVVFVGFPEGIPRLHAVLGTAEGFSSGILSVRGHGCKLAVDAAAFEGMSGGGVFRGGKFEGIVNAGTSAGLNAYMYYTPAEAIQLAYAKLFPQIAELAGVSSDVLSQILSQLPAECSFKGQAPSLLTLASR